MYQCIVHATYPGRLWSSIPVLLSGHTIRRHGICSTTFWTRTDVHSKKVWWWHLDNVSHQTHVLVHVNVVLVLCHSNLQLCTGIQKTQLSVLKRSLQCSLVTMRQWRYLARYMQPLLIIRRGRMQRSLYNWSFMCFAQFWCICVLYTIIFCVNECCMQVNIVHVWMCVPIYFLYLLFDCLTCPYWRMYTLFID